MENDRIKREIVVAASPERVWAALTEPNQMVGWLGSHVEIDLRPGGEAVFVWEGYDPSRGRIEVVEPPRCFAFRWQATGSDPSLPVEATPNTLVEFTLEPISEGTRLTLVESGFADLPPDARRDNEEGWDEELHHFLAYLSATDAVRA